MPGALHVLSSVILITIYEVHIFYYPLFTCEEMKGYKG